MSANKSSQVAYHPASNTLVLSIGDPSAFQPTNNKLFPPRVKRLQHPDSLRRQKAVKIIEDIANYHINNEK